jgi:molybdate-binding protein
VPAGNPTGIRTAADLAQPGLRLVNREPGAGSRALLDGLLAAAGVSGQAVAGYDRTAASHFEVAAAVASGGADAGIALAAAALTYGLDFVPLAEVRFDLVIPADHLAHPAIGLLLEALQTRALRDELGALPGYDVSEMGAIRAEYAATAA